MINEQGADHHGTITRVRAELQGLDAGIRKAGQNTCCTKW